jgi:hypothetical protein
VGSVTVLLLSTGVSSSSEFSCSDDSLGGRRTIPLRRGNVFGSCYLLASGERRDVSCN